MFLWMIGLIITYLLIGFGLTWMLSEVGEEKFKFTKEPVSFILT